jgi:hypothetical protein
LAARYTISSARVLIPEIGVWRAALLMLKRYGEKALEESAACPRACIRWRWQRGGYMAPDDGDRDAARRDAHRTKRKWRPAIKGHAIRNVFFSDCQAARRCERVLLGAPADAC